jgi:hypothetical protein
MKEFIKEQLYVDYSETTEPTETQENGNPHITIGGEIWFD